jgi:hypothetical protein
MSRPEQDIGRILVPSDGMVLFFFRAPNEGLVKDQSWPSEVPFNRIVESIQIGLDHQCSCPAQWPLAAVNGLSRARRCGSSCGRLPVCSAEIALPRRYRRDRRCSAGRPLVAASRPW